MNKKVFLIVVFLVLLVIFIVPKGKNDNIQINSKQYSEGSGSKTAVEYLKEKSNDISVTNYNDGNKGEMYTFNHEATYQTPALTDYRYIGNEPNNYVKFNCDEDGTNCEIWRIVGVFAVDDGTGNFEQRIKLVRGSSFADGMAWNIDDKNDWTNASLKTFFNGDYYNKTGDAAIYGLKSSTRDMIGDAVYYLGSFVLLDGNMGVDSFYNLERGNILCGACNSDTTKLKWIGKVGLMYTSDMYAGYGKGVNTSCYENVMNCSGANAQTGWIYNSNIREGLHSIDSDTWFITPELKSSYFSVSSIEWGYASGIGLQGVSGTIGTRPVAYLKSDIYINAGDGSVDNPYSLSLTPVVDDNSIIDDNGSDNDSNNNDSNNNSNNSYNSIDNNSNKVVDNSTSSVVVDNNKSKVIVTVANTLKYMSWIIIALSVAIVIIGCSILGYNYYKSRKER